MTTGVVIDEPEKVAGSYRERSRELNDALFPGIVLEPDFADRTTVGIVLSGIDGLGCREFES